jgi:DNA-nicking Smr family endonuclease
MQADLARRYTSLADLRDVRRELKRRQREAEALAQEREEHERRLAAAAKEAARVAAVQAADLALFRTATADVEPLPAGNAVELDRERPAPIPRQRLADEKRVVSELLKPVSDWESDLETGESLTFVRQGLGRDILRKLRRGQWVVQAALDLHGMNREEARLALGTFLQHAIKEGYRCVRVIHGKGLGSHNREPILKHKVKRYLQQREEVLAFVEARNVDGGGGAVMVLLKGGPA